VDEETAAALWVQAHSPVDDADLWAHIARLEATVYSKSGSTEAVVDFVDPVTGDSIRATPSQLRLQVLRARATAVATPTADTPNRERSAQAEAPIAVESPGLVEQRNTAPESSTRHRSRRRFVLPLVAVTCFAVGVVTTLVAGSVLSSGSDSTPASVVGATPTSTSTPMTAFPAAEERAVAPPTTQGTTLSQWASLPSDASVGGEVDALGDGLIVAIDCAGQGTVTVDVGGYLSVFTCVPGQVQGFTNYDYTPHGTADVMITPLGNVSWGVTVASIPLDTPVSG